MAPEESEFPDACERPPVPVIFLPHRVTHKESELALADHIIVGSNFVRRSLVEAGFRDETITVLPSACEATWLARAASQEPAVGNANVVLHIGRLSLRKGTHRLLRAWKRLKAYRTHRLHLIGTMHLRREFLSQFQGCFEHTGWVHRDTLYERYRSSTCFVLPAAAEGMAGVILEAVACGVPVVASRNSGAEGLLEHRKDCLLHEYGDDEALCEHLDWMLSHPRERAEMARQAQEKASKWTWPDFRSTFLRVMNGLQARSSQIALVP
jgi:glycosyltransferase involved in cell wall biosynthesis